MPIMASKPAALTSGMPQSNAAEMRCVPMSPLVLAPQTKKDAASSQKSRTRIASTSVPTACFTGLPGATGAVFSAGPVSPYGRRPTSRGSSRISQPMTGIASRVAPATIHGAARQLPWLVTALASSGRKTSWPVAVLAVSRPVTSPRFSVNHRFATAAPSTVAAMPEPAPTTTPHSTTNCQ